MIHVLTPEENALRFLIDLGKDALVDGHVKSHFAKYAQEKQSYEAVFLRLLQELPRTCSNPGCPHHWPDAAKQLAAEAGAYRELKQELLRAESVGARHEILKRLVIEAGGDPSMVKR